LLSDLDKAFEVEKHKYRYKNDFDYRRSYNRQEAKRRRVENLRGETESAVFISLIIFLGYYMLPVVTGL
jgi:hypothetical protein